MTSSQTHISTSNMKVVLAKPLRSSLRGGHGNVASLRGRGCVQREAVSQQQTAASLLSSIEMAPADPVLGITEAFKADTSPNKLNLGVGAFRTEELQPYVLGVVRKAEENMLKANENKEYLPIEGLASFRKATVDLLLGDNPAVKEGRVATLQALSGTGALAVAAQLIHAYMPNATVYISNPTWPNHKNIFTLAGVKWDFYRYFDSKTIGLDFDGMLADINAAPNGSVILLHGCAHNPTGVDPTEEQWAKIADAIEAKGHLTFFDVAYQGFATGSLDRDAFAPRYFVDRGLEVMVAQSYSKNLGLYAERIGALNIITKDKETATRVLSQMKRLARATWSSPPVHGARIVAEVVSDQVMFSEWNKEMEYMSGRIINVRKALYKELVALMPEKDWSFVINQIGMFTYTSMTKKQCENMTGKWKIYMTMDGRLSLAGLPEKKAGYLAQAVVDSFKNH